MFLIYKKRRGIVMKAVLWLVLGCCLQGSLRAVLFHNALAQDVVIRSVCLAVNHIGPDPYNGMYIVKHMKNPRSIGLRNKRDFVILDSDSFILKPGEEKEFKNFGLSQIFCVMDPDLDKFSDDVHSKAVDDWLKGPCETVVFSALFGVRPRRVVTSYKDTGIVIKESMVYEISKLK